METRKDNVKQWMWQLTQLAEGAGRTGFTQREERTLSENKEIIKRPTGKQLPLLTFKKKIDILRL